MIGINIGAQTTKFTGGFLTSKKERYETSDFKINPFLNDILDRVNLSIIQFKEANIFFSNSTKLGYKKYYKSTFENLSRLIGFSYNLGINKKEIDYLYTFDNYNKENNTFNFKLKEKEYSLTGEQCVYAYINEIDKKIKNKLNTTEPQKYIFSIPDYYTFFQKESLKNILDALNLNNIAFLNESTALTMYYGYLNYRELTNEIKSYIFIDIGHSKTSIFLSQFSRKKFSVKRVINIPFLGGRDINRRIFDLCLQEFEKQNNKKLIITGRNKIRLLDEIESAKKNLSINTEALINVESIIEDIDFSYVLTRQTFEKIISNELDLLTSQIKIFLLYVKKYKPTKIEMSGQLMRIPIFQERISEIFELPISKTIALDECHSLGSLLYGYFILEKNRFNELESVESLINNSFYFQINQIKQTAFILDNIPLKGTIFIRKINSFENVINLKIFYHPHNFDENECFDSKTELYSFNCSISELKNKILSSNKTPCIFIDYKINESHGFEFKIGSYNFVKEDIGFFSSFKNKEIIENIRTLSLK